MKDGKVGINQGNGDGSMALFSSFFSCHPLSLLHHVINFTGLFPVSMLQRSGKSPNENVREQKHPRSILHRSILHVKGE